MSYQASANVSSDALTPASNFFSLGSDLLKEVQQIIGHSRVKALRFNIAGKLIKEIPVNPATAIVTVLLVVAAVVVSNLQVEVVKEPLSSSKEVAG